jgi:hypothetical protein
MRSRMLNAYLEGAAAFFGTSTDVLFASDPHSLEALHWEYAAFVEQVHERRCGPLRPGSGPARAHRAVCDCIDAVNTAARAGGVEARTHWRFLRDAFLARHAEVAEGGAPALRRGRPTQD